MSVDVPADNPSRPESDDAVPSEREVRVGRRRLGCMKDPRVDRTSRDRPLREASCRVSCLAGRDVLMLEDRARAVCAAACAAASDIDGCSVVRVRLSLCDAASRSAARRR